MTALDERNGISVVLHMAKDTPRPDVSVYVVSTISKNSSPLFNYVFQAVVPKVFLSLRKSSSRSYWHLKNWLVTQYLLFNFSDVQVKIAPSIKFRAPSTQSFSSSVCYHTSDVGCKPFQGII